MVLITIIIYFLNVCYRKFLEIKKLIAIICFLICLTPIWAVAEEPVYTPAGEGFILSLLEERSERLPAQVETCYDFSLPQLVEKEGTRLTDKELDSIVAKGFDVLPSQGKMEIGRIILWDEASDKSKEVGALVVRILIY
jgi:hypothetical protein